MKTSAGNNSHKSSSRGKSKKKSSRKSRENKHSLPSEAMERADSAQRSTRSHRSNKSNRSNRSTHSSRKMGGSQSMIRDRDAMTMNGVNSPGAAASNTSPVTGVGSRNSKQVNVNMHYNAGTAGNSINR